MTPRCAMEEKKRHLFRFVGVFFLFVCSGEHTTRFNSVWIWMGSISPRGVAVRLQEMDSPAVQHAPSERELWKGAFSYSVIMIMFRWHQDLIYQRGNARGKLNVWDHVLCWSGNLISITYCILGLIVSSLVNLQRWVLIGIKGKCSIKIT